MIGTHRTLGIGLPASALLYVIALPVGPYYPTSFKAVTLEATGYAVRAWPGGFGDIGTMNLFAAMKNKETGQNELLTPPLDGAILDGVTRDSVLGLAHDRLVPQGWGVSERKFTMRELADAADEGRMIEVFGAGTATVVSPGEGSAGKDDCLNAAWRTTLKLDRAADEGLDRVYPV